MVSSYAKNYKKRYQPNKLKVMLENPWIGYSGLDRLNSVLPSLGLADRKSMDTVNNMIYALRSSDYGKDTDDMANGIKYLRSILFDN